MAENVVLISVVLCDRVYGREADSIIMRGQIYIYRVCCTAMTKADAARFLCSESGWRLLSLVPCRG